MSRLEGNVRASKAYLTEDADSIACRTQSLIQAAASQMCTAIEQAPNRHYQLWLPNFTLSNLVFTSWVLGQIFERHYFHTSSHARLASFFILVFLFIATGILHCPSSLSSSLSSYLDTFTICAPYHDVPNL